MKILSAVLVIVAMAMVAMADNEFITRKEFMVCVAECLLSCLVSNDGANSWKLAWWQYLHLVKISYCRKLQRKCSGSLSNNLSRSFSSRKRSIKNWQKRFWSWRWTLLPSCLTLISWRILVIYFEITTAFHTMRNLYFRAKNKFLLASQWEIFTWVQISFANWYPFRLHSQIICSCIHNPNLCLATNKQLSSRIVCSILCSLAHLICSARYLCSDRHTVHSVTSSAALSLAELPARSGQEHFVAFHLQGNSFIPQIHHPPTHNAESTMPHTLCLSISLFTCFMWPVCCFSLSVCLCLSPSQTHRSAHSYYLPQFTSPMFLTLAAFNHLLVPVSVSLFLSSHSCTQCSEPDHWGESDNPWGSGCCSFIWCGRDRGGCWWPVWSAVSSGSKTLHSGARHWWSARWNFQSG